jgi:phosphatidylglycerophosphate synthase
MTYQEIRKEQYHYHSQEQFRDMREPIKSPYTFVKHHFNMELAAILVYLLQWTGIHPNFITYTYLLFGLFGGILLVTKNKLCVLISLVLFFTKGILDWADGHYARLVGKTSLAGEDLDRMCGTVTTVSFYAGLAVYLFNRESIFFLLMPLLLFKSIHRIFPFGRARVMDFIILLILIDTFFW